MKRLLSTFGCLTVGDLVASAQQNVSLEVQIHSTGAGTVDSAALVQTQGNGEIGYTPAR